MNALNHSRPLALFGLLLANLCWSGNALVARAFAGEIAPFTLSFWRWCLALALLLPFVAMPLWRHRVAVRTAGWRLLVLGGLGIAGYNSLLYSAAQTTAAINISLVNTKLTALHGIAQAKYGMAAASAAAAAAGTAAGGGGGS